MSEQSKEATKKLVKKGQIKISLEINCPGNGKTFLNFWNSETGDDVTAELKNGKLHYANGRVTTLEKFITRVKKTAKRDLLKSLA